MEARDLPKPTGMNPLVKDRFDVTSKSVAIVGGLLSAVALVWTLSSATEQRARELRWEQARLGMELVDEMLADPMAMDALRMTDWEGYRFVIRRDTIPITSADVRLALDVSLEEPPPYMDFIRERYDRLFYHLGRMQRSRESGLVTLADVSEPMAYYSYYFDTRYGEVGEEYMAQLGHVGASTFLKTLNSLRAEDSAP